MKQTLFIIILGLGFSIAQAKTFHYLESTDNKEMRVVISLTENEKGFEEMISNSQGESSKLFLDELFYTTT